MNNEKINSKIKLSNNSPFVILIFTIWKFRSIGRSTFRRSKFWNPVAPFSIIFVEHDEINLKKNLPLDLRVGYKIWNDQM